MFEYCGNLIDVTIPDSVISIGESAFSQCGLTYITIPNSVTQIDKYAFSGSRLTGITIPDSVTYIGMGAFYRCFDLTYATISNGIGNIPNSAFSWCTELADITIPENVISIDSSAFSNCKSLSTVIIPDNVISIENDCFNGCSSLKSVVISDSIINIGYQTFEGCTDLTDIYYTGTKEEWDEIDIEVNNTVLTDSTIHYNYVFPITIIYNSNGGENAPDNQNADQNSTATLSLDVPTKEGYVFLGWATKPDASEARYHAGDTITVLQKNISLYAIWKLKMYTKTEFINNIFVVKPTGIPEGSIIMFACYMNGKIVYLSNYVYDESFVVPFSTDMEYDKVKIFVWESIESLKAICESEQCVIEF